MAKRLIDAMALVTRISRKVRHMYTLQDIYDAVLQCIAEAPTVDAVEVIRGLWVLVTERLPEPEKRVLILTRVKGWNGKMYREIMCGFYEDGNILCEDSKVCWDYEMKREENYDESRDDYTVPEGWFEELLNHIDDFNCVGIGDPVTHWMPLPESLKEVT